MKEWNLDHPSMQSPAAHEPCAVLRMHNSGVRSQAILDMLRLRGTQLIKQIELSKVELADAASKGRPIHDALIEIPKEKS